MRNHHVEATILWLRHGSDVATALLTSRSDGTSGCAGCGGKTWSTAAKTSRIPTANLRFTLVRALNMAYSLVSRLYKNSEELAYVYIYMILYVYIAHLLDEECLSPGEVNSETPSPSRAAQRITPSPPKLTQTACAGCVLGKASKTRGVM